MVYLGTKVKERVNADVELLQVTKDLRERGVTLVWNPKKKFEAGGLTLTITGGAAPLVVAAPTKAEPDKTAV